MIPTVVENGFRCEDPEFAAARAHARECLKVLQRRGERPWPPPTPVPGNWTRGPSPGVMTSRRDERNQDRNRLGPPDPVLRGASLSDGKGPPHLRRNREYGAALATLLLRRLVARRRRAPFYPIPGASLFGGSGSLFARFNSLFARLGNLLYDAAEINDLAASVRSRKAAGRVFRSIFPSTRELR